MTTQACIKTSAIVAEFAIPNLEAAAVDNTRNYAIVSMYNSVLVEVFSTDAGLTMIETLKGEAEAYNTNELFIREAIEEALHIAYMEFKQGTQSEVITYHTWLTLERVG
jgi:hypothetical protein